MNTLANAFESAVRDGEDLAPWAARNVAVLEDERTDYIVRAVLSDPLPPELSLGVPLLRFGNSAPAVPLVHAVACPPEYVPACCDRCQGAKHGIASVVWVPTGASVVALGLCWKCEVHLTHGRADALVLTRRQERPGGHLYAVPEE